MIRELRKADINIVADIWLDTNIPAVSFYQREGFEIQYSGLDEATGEKDYVMAWQQENQTHFDRKLGR